MGAGICRFGEGRGLLGGEYAGVVVEGFFSSVGAMGEGELSRLSCWRNGFAVPRGVPEKISDRGCSTS